MGNAVLATPYPFGHESKGKVSQVGAAASPLDHADGGVLHLLALFFGDF